MSRHRMWWGAIVLLALAGCGSPEQAETDQQAVNSGLSELRPEAPTDEPADEQGLDWLVAQQPRLFEELEGLQTQQAQAAAPVEEPEPDPEPEPAEPAATPEPEQQAPPPEPKATPPTPAERLATLTDEIAAILRESESDDPYALALRLAALRGVAGTSPEDLNRMVESLPVDERDIVRALLGVLAAGETDPRALAEAFEAHATQLSESRPIRIGTTALCSRVEGFGRYTELDSQTFVAGSDIRMIIYTEVEHFDQAEYAGSGPGSTPEPPGWEVSLSQELLLYHESDGLLAWRQPEERTVYRSRSRLRDYFLVNRVELPRTLTVGAYRLKIVMRDLHDGSVDERIVPIRVVADPRLATGSGG